MIAPSPSPPLCSYSLLLSPRNGVFGPILYLKRHNSHTSIAGTVRSVPFSLVSLFSPPGKMDKTPRGWSLWLNGCWGAASHFPFVTKPRGKKLRDQGQEESMYVELRAFFRQCTLPSIFTFFRSTKTSID